MDEALAGKLGLGWYLNWRVTPAAFRSDLVTYAPMIRLTDGRADPSGDALLAAVDAPRLHCSIEGKVSLEAARMRDDIPKILERHGFEIDVRNPYSFYLGCVQLVMRDRKTLIGVADPRRDGSARGPARLLSRAAEDEP